MKIGNTRVLGDLLADQWKRVYSHEVAVGEGLDSYDKLSISFDGTDGATSHTAQTGHTVTFNGTASLNVGGALLLDGNSDYVTLADSDDWNFGTGDFTIDFWVRFASVASHQCIVSQATSTSKYWQIIAYAGTFIKFTSSETGGGDTGDFYASWAPSINTWYHVTFVRNGSTAKFYIDGVGLTTNTSVAFGTLPNCSGALTLGMRASDSDYFLNGWIDEFRLSKGIARWTSDFTPQLTPYTLDAYTKCLIHVDGKDATTVVYEDSGKTVTIAGTAQIDTAQYKIPVAKFGTAALWLDGNSDYVTVPDNADWNFSSGNFTIDFWIKPNSFGNGNVGLISQYADGDNVWWLEFENTGGTDIYFGSKSGGTLLHLFDAGAHGLILGAWTHIALVRYGNIFTIYINGVAQATTSTDADALPDISGLLYIGASPRNGTNYYFNGWIDGLRIAKGIARWTSNFTPPTAEYGLTSLTISGLDGNTAEEYILKAQIIGGRTASPSPYILVRLNNDSGANYGQQFVAGYSSTTEANRYTNNTGIYLCEWRLSLAYSLQSELTLYAKSGFVRTGHIKSANNITGTTIGYSWLSGESWNNTADNITSMVIVASELCGIGAGSIIELYAKKTKV